MKVIFRIGIIAVLVAIFLLLVSGCAPLIMPPPTDTEIQDSPADLVYFDSLDAFVAAINQKQNDSSNDIANLAELDVYYVASGLPDGFELGEIIAGTSDIMFLYYPSDALLSKESKLTGKTPFELIFRRWDLENPLSGIMEQLGQNSSDLIDGKYLYDSSNRTIYWVENETDVLSLTIPMAFDFSQNEISVLCSVVAVDCIYKIANED